MIIDPTEWLEEANKYRPILTGTTEWFPGDIAPVRSGWYERFFTDSRCDVNPTFQFFDGEKWLPKPGAKPHWRQVGDYPSWRGRKERGFDRMLESYRKVA